VINSIKKNSADETAQLFSELDRIKTEIKHMIETELENNKNIVLQTANRGTAHRESL
jgi:hypothetical protein